MVTPEALQRQIRHAPVSLGTPRRPTETSKGLSAALFAERDQIVRMGNPPVRIELLTSVSGVSFPERFSRRQEATLDGLQVNLISLEDLERNKRAAGRDKDRNDLSNLP